MGTGTTGDVEEVFLLRRQDPTHQEWAEYARDAAPDPPAVPPAAGRRGRLLAALAR